MLHPHPSLLRQNQSGTDLFIPDPRHQASYPARVPSHLYLILRPQFLHLPSGDTSTTHLPGPWPELSSGVLHPGGTCRIIGETTTRTNTCAHPQVPLGLIASAFLGSGAWTAAFPYKSCQAISRGSWEGKVLLCAKLLSHNLARSGPSANGSSRFVTVYYCAKCSTWPCILSHSFETSGLY